MQLPRGIVVQIDAATLAATDFAVVTQAGVVKTPACATLAPSIESDELRTVPLIGDLGGVADPPLRVDVVGEPRGLGGQLLRDATPQPITPLADGPSVVLAEGVAMPDPELDALGGCPSVGTQQVVTVTWNGGVRDTAGGQAFDVARHRGTLADGTEVAPVSLADLDDDDNVQDLCLDVATPARSVRVLAATTIDPAGDANPETRIDVP